MRSFLPAFLSLLLVVALGCSAPVRKTVYSQESVEVSKRHYRDATSTLARGYEHPAQLALEPLAYSLAAIRVGELDDREVPERRAIHLDLVAGIARGLVAGFAEASPDEELVVIATRKEKTVGIFHRRLLTSFVAFRKNGELVLDFAYTDKPIAKADERKELPAPEIGQKRMNFRVLPGDGVQPHDGQVALVRWPGTAANAATPQVAAPSLSAGESAISVEAESALPDATSSALRELDAALERGEIAEVYYERKRAELLRDAGAAAP